MCVDNTADIKITATGQHIAHYTLTPDKIYYNQKDNELNPNPGNKNKESPRHNRNDVSRHHSVPSAMSEVRT